MTGDITKTIESMKMIDDLVDKFYELKFRRMNKVNSKGFKTVADISREHRNRTQYMKTP